MRNSYGILAVNSENKRPIAEPKRRMGSNLKFI
jgi:hypothetical protein